MAGRRKPPRQSSARKPGPDRYGVWDPKSRAKSGTASGLTQFLRDTWLTSAQRQGSYLNGRARDLGWLDKHGRIDPAHRNEFLNLRFNAEDSINAALDDASNNIAYLRARGLIQDNSPAALARYAYIAHHEGAAGAAAYLSGDPLQLSDKHWNRNVPRREQARYLAANGNDRSAAYRAYMDDYIDGRIDPRRFMVDSTGVQVPAMGTLYRRPPPPPMAADQPPTPALKNGPAMPELRGRPPAPGLPAGRRRW